MGKAGEKTALSSQKLEIDQLNDTVEQQKAEIDHLRWLLDDIGAGNLLSLSHAAMEKQAVLHPCIFLSNMRSCSEL